MNQVKSYLQVPLVGRSALVSVSTVAGAWVKYRVSRLQSDNCSPFENIPCPVSPGQGRRRGVLEKDAFCKVRTEAIVKLSNESPAVAYDMFLKNKIKATCGRVYRSQHTLNTNHCLNLELLHQHIVMLYLASS